MRREQLVEKMERAWGELTESYVGLPDERMVEAGVVGEWSVKDVLAHVTTWEEEALTHLPHILAGKPRRGIGHVWGCRRVQCVDDGAEARAVAGRGAAAVGGDARSHYGVCGGRAGGTACDGDAVSKAVSGTTRMGITEGMRR